jgi:hypothetical protein
MGLLNLLTDPKNFKFYNGGQGYTGNGSVPNLKNIPYGKDRIDGGSSNQPYIQTPIPDGTSTLGIFNNDFIWRGGINAPLNSAQDVQRLTKMFVDTKTPSGLFFAIKQNVLSRTAVRTEVSQGILNEGVYNPLNTLAQAGIVAFGGHLNKQGKPYTGTTYTDVITLNNQPYNLQYKTTALTTFSYEPPSYNVAYELGDITGGITENTTFITERDRGQSNRLLNLWDKFIDVKNTTPVLQSYTGGPGAPSGVGSTNIKITNQRTGINNSLRISNPGYFIGNGKNDQPTFLHTRTNIVPYNVTTDVYTVSNRYRTAFLDSNINLFPATDFDTTTGVKIYNNSVYQNKIYSPQNNVINRYFQPTPLVNAQNTYTYTQQDLVDTPITPGKLSFSPASQDFRKILREDRPNQPGLTSLDANINGQLTNAPSYDIAKNKTIEGRVNLGNPGARSGNSYANYTSGVVYNYLNGGKTEALDKLNAYNIYYQDEVKSNSEAPINDLVKFRIAIIDNEVPNKKHFIHFRAFLDSISDSYNATWNSVQYLGRGENFYTYNGFTRQISLSWTVAAQSKQELIPMYKKLNFLASSLTPDYSGYGYMRGNLAQLTIGGYVYEQPGIITGLTYTMDENTPWEIGINTNGNYDKSVKELAHIIRVTGFTFIPIHRFRPERQYNEDDYKQYIALANGFGEEDNNYGTIPPKVVNLDNQTTSAQQTDPQVNTTNTESTTTSVTTNIADATLDPNRDRGRLLANFKR